MFAIKYISDVIPALKNSDTGVNALNWMEVYRISHLPVVSNEKFIGVLSDAEIYDLNKADEQIASYTLQLQNIYIKENQHVYEALRLMFQNNLSIIPVVDDELKYLGVISYRELMEALNDIINLQNPGGLLVLEMPVQNYSLVEVSQIVESNNARILSSYVSSSDSITALLTLKINSEDLSAIIQTFERYDYYIKYSFNTNDLSESITRERYESLMNYLNV